MTSLSRIQLAACSLIAATSLAVATPGQTQLVRGDVDGIQGTLRFQLDCTNIELVSSTVNLQALENQSRQNDIEFDMQVTVVSAGPPTTLNVLSAVAVPEVLDMGNLRLGETNSWEVFGQPGSTALVFVGDRAFTGYFPIGALGTWVLGGPIALMAQGPIAFNGQFRFNFTTPTNPAFLGVEITSQAIIQDPDGTLSISHPDCKTVEN